MLCAMYFAQGLPWGFMVTALVAFLTDEHGINETEAGRLTAVVLWPWTFKLVWAPLIDTVTIRSMGRRRPWIIGAELLMAVSLLGILAMGDLSNNLSLLAWMFFIHNCFASLQDVSTDALAIDILPANEQGLVNGLMWGTKLAGKAIGAFGMAYVIYEWGLSAAVLVQFISLLIIMLFPLLCVERPGDRRLPWTRPIEPESAEDVLPQNRSTLRSPWVVLRDLVRGFSLKTTFFLLLYGVMHVIGWGIVEVVYKTLYTQQLGWTYVDISRFAFYAMFTEMAGAILGGVMADRVGRRIVMVAGFGTYGLLAFVFGACPHLWHSDWFSASYLILNPGALAFGAVGFLSMGMRISWTKSSASMFTIYMTLSNVGHVIGNEIVGPLRTEYGFSFEHTFWWAALSMIAPLFLLFLVRPETVDAMRDQEALEKKAAEP